jgi:hypothetical protein
MFLFCRGFIFADECPRTSCVHFFGVLKLIREVPCQLAAVGAFLDDGPGADAGSDGRLWQSAVFVAD